MDGVLAGILAGRAIGGIIGQYLSWRRDHRRICRAGQGITDGIKSVFRTIRRSAAAWIIQPHAADPRLKNVGQLRLVRSPTTIRLYSVPRRQPTTEPGHWQCVISMLLHPDGGLVPAPVPAAFSFLPEVRYWL